jgi:hypothetical protein
VPNGEAILKEYDQAMAAFVAGEPVKVNEKWPDVVRLVVAAATNPFNQPFSRELWTLDPLTLLKKVTAPVLVTIGKKDIQIDWQTEGAFFTRIAGEHSNITVVFPENANHVLEHEPRPRSELTAAVVQASYNAADAVLDPDVVDTITSWLKAHM